MPIAIATSTAHKTALNKLRNTELLPYFDFVIGGDQVANSKPDPEIYQTAARRHGAAPHRCIAFEDSANGVLAAHRAGIPVIQIPDLVSPTQELRALGHCILESLLDVESHHL